MIEMNRAEYFVRSLGWIEDVTDVEESVIKSIDGVPIRVKDVAHVSIGPALRRGALDKGGAEAVGGVVVARYGENPLQVIENVKARIAEDRARVAPQDARRRDRLPAHGRAVLRPLGPDPRDARHARVGDREEILVTILVVVFMLMHLRSSVLVSALLPLAVLFTFGLMKLFGVDANIVALSGIAIAIGTIVDMGIVLSENILRRLEQAEEDARPLESCWKPRSRWAPRSSPRSSRP